MGRVSKVEALKKFTFFFPNKPFPEIFALDLSFGNKSINIALSCW